MANTDDPTKDLKDPENDETRQVIRPDAGHTYGFGSESVNDQLKQISASGEVADLKAEVEQVKARLSAVETVLFDIAQRLKDKESGQGS